MRTSATTAVDTLQKLAEQTSANSAHSKNDASKAPPPPPPPPPQFASPITAFDAVTGATVLEYRNTKTGTEDYQSPARAVLQYQQSLLASIDKQTGKTTA